MLSRLEKFELYKMVPGKSVAASKVRKTFPDQILFIGNKSVTLPSSGGSRNCWWGMTLPFLPLLPSHPSLSLSPSTPSSGDKHKV